MNIADRPQGKKSGMKVRYSTGTLAPDRGQDLITVLVENYTPLVEEVSIRLLDKDSVTSKVAGVYGGEVGSESTIKVEFPLQDLVYYEVEVEVPFKQAGTGIVVAVYGFKGHEVVGANTLRHMELTKEYLEDWEVY